jgi:hypothetical protein
LFPGYKGPWSVSFISFIVRSTSVHIPIWESCIISWLSVSLVEETGVPRENHWPALGHWQTLSHNVVSSTPRLSGFELTTLVVMCTDCIGSYKSNYHTITTAPYLIIYIFSFKKERKIRVIFFLCRGCDILALKKLFPGYKGPWSVSFFSFIVRSTSVHIPIWESCNLFFLLRKKEKLGLYFFSVGDVIYWFWYSYFWIAITLKRLLFFVIFLYTINKNKNSLILITKT